eukprot:2886328-Amphidinium_carterae.1
MALSTMATIKNADAPAGRTCTLPLREFPDQTINQAETYAILQALRYTHGDIHIVTDSQHCHNIFQQLEELDLTDVANVHIWHHILHQKRQRRCTIEKIRSHQSKPAMHEEAWTHGMGNDAADRWAGAALRGHPAITRHDQSIRDLLNMQI